MAKPQQLRAEWATNAGGELGINLSSASDPADQPNFLPAHRIDEMLEILIASGQKEAADHLIQTQPQF